jgi:hypothetical protein
VSADAAERWLATQDPAQLEGFGWLRALGRFYGVPPCCVEHFVAVRETAAFTGVAPDAPGPLHPTRGYVMCGACAADPERADRLAAASLAERIAPAEG